MKLENPSALSVKQQRFLLAALFCAGAASLILEIVGARLISPYYGSSLYTWSALITVTLVALAAGYNLGGREAQTAGLAHFSRRLAAAGLAVAVMPILRIPVLSLTTPMGIQLGSLASATVLAGPSLMLLGTLGPIAVRLIATDLVTAGKSAGDVYALSTLGSVAGAVLAGFVLIPHFPLTQILCAVAIVLLALGAIGIYLSTLRVAWRQAAAAAAAALLGFWPRSLAGTKLLLSRESAYAQIKVLEEAEAGKRSLLVNGTSQSIALLPSGSIGGERLESASPYVHALEAPALMNPRPKRALAVGLGAGLLPGALEKIYGVTTDVVEIDPAMVATAKDFFGFAPRGDVFQEDGRTYVERAQRRYDYVILDAFGGEAPPYHLFTAEAFSAIRRVMTPDAVLAVNLFSLMAPGENRAYLGTYRTLHAVFPEIHSFIAGAPVHGLANILFFCSARPLDFGALRGVGRPLVRDDFAATFSDERIPTERELLDAPLMTDDYAPMESLMAPTAVAWRSTLQTTISSVLLY